MPEWNQSDVADIAAQLDLLAKSPVFAHVDRLVAFLRYIVDTETAGNGTRIGQMAIAMDVLGRDEGFDPTTDSIVRMEAARLRTKLRDYYDADGAGDRIRFALPKGTYRPSIEVAADPPAAPQPEAAVQHHHDGSAIAVLPFANMSGDPAQEYFSDGISEEILNSLNRVPGLHVAARTSAFSFKHRDVDIETIGRQLHVDYVLEGSVRLAGEHLRVDAQLIKVMDGFQVWSDTYDRDLTDIFAIQDEIAHAITDALKVRLTNGQKASLIAPVTANIEAYNDYLEGRFWLNKWGVSNFEKAAECFDRAIELDSKFSDALGCLAYTYGVWSIYGRVYYFLPRIEMNRSRALVLDPDQPEALASCFRLFGQTFDWEEINHQFEWAMQGGAGNSLIVVQYVFGYLYATGQLEEGLELLAKAERDDPLSAIIKVSRARLLYALGKADEAAQVCEDALALEPNNYMGLYILGEISASCGEFGRAEEIVERLEDVGGENDPFSIYTRALVMQGKGKANAAEAQRQLLIQNWASTLTPYPAPYYIGRLSISLGDIEQGMFWFQVAFHERDINIARLRTQYRNVPEVWEHPVCQALAGKMNLDDATLKILLERRQAHTIKPQD